jgi:hypothetical protein
MASQYHWKYWGFPQNRDDAPSLLKVSTDSFRTEIACVVDARRKYTSLKFPYMVVLSVINEPPAKHPSMSVESSRVLTFEEWPICMPFTAQEMAAAGLFYRGRSDRVICYSCGVILKKWNPNDRPMSEHQRHSPECFHVQMMSTSLTGDMEMEVVMKYECG